MSIPKVAFVCTHNSCRSQMAEAISRLLAADAFEAFSAGTDIADKVNPGAVEAIQSLYGYDMGASQLPKTIADLPPVDVVVTMGCGVECPYLPARDRRDWGLEDPSGKPLEEYLACASIIEQKVKALRDELKHVEHIGEGRDASEQGER